MYSTLINIQQIIGKMMSMIDVENSMLKNLNVTNLKEMTTDNIGIFSNKQKSVIDVFRVDIHTTRKWKVPFHE